MIAMSWPAKPSQLGIIQTDYGSTLVAALLCRDGFLRQESQYEKLIIAVMLGLGRSESPNQNGIPHHLGIFLVAKTKHLSNTQLIHQTVQYIFIFYKHIFIDTISPYAP